MRFAAVLMAVTLVCGVTASPAVARGGGHSGTHVFHDHFSKSFEVGRPLPKEGSNLTFGTRAGRETTLLLGLTHLRGFKIPSYRPSRDASVRSEKAAKASLKPISKSWFGL